MILRIDYRRFLKFRLLTPKIHVGNQFYNKYNVYWLGTDTRTFSIDQVDFCLNFIIESGLRL